jgi:hypothetical protein
VVKTMSISPASSAITVLTQAMAAKDNKGAAPAPKPAAPAASAPADADGDQDGSVGRLVNVKA